MTEKIDLWGEVLRVSTVVSAAKNEDEQAILLAGELERVVNAATNEIEAERDALAKTLAKVEAERDLAIQTQDGALDAQADVERRMFAMREERDEARHERDEHAATLARVSLAQLRSGVAEAERDKLAAAIAKINKIRNDIVGSQAVNWSEHVYPLVAALNEAGVEGMPYPEAREVVATRIARLREVEAERDEARSQLAALRAAVEVRLASKNVLEANDAERRLRAVAKDTVAAAEAHDRKTEAKALEDAAAGCLVEVDPDPDGIATEIQAWLRARASEIRDKR
jgi:hypothetical protein